MSSNMNQFLISIIICTYNRARLLKEVLSSLEKQQAHYSKFEVIIIDNKSSDDTKKYCLDYIERHSELDIKYHFEEVQGLSHCRNVGYKIAKYEYVGYIDDDAIAPDNWINYALDIIEKYQPDVFGGPIYPFYLSNKPSWFDDKFEIRIHQENSGWMQKGAHISGSNMFFKKAVLHELHGFDTKFGRKGNKLLYASENRPIQRAFDLDKKVYYSKDLIVQHWVPEFKMNTGYQFYMSFEQPKNGFYIHNKYKKLPLEAIAHEIVQNLDTVQLNLKSFSEKLQSDNNLSWETYFMKEIKPVFHRIGFLKTQFEENKKRKNRFDQLLSYSVEKIYFIIKNKINFFSNKE